MLIKHLYKFNVLKHRFIGGSSGIMLIGLVITMIILAILGAVIVQTFSTSTMNEVSANLNHKAKYMAESGYRYAASQYLNGTTGEARDDVLTEINTKKTYSLTPSPLSFDLEIGGYYYKYNNSPTVSTFGTVPKEIIDRGGPAGNGRVAVFAADKFNNLVTYSGYTTTNTSITFTGGTWPTTGARLFPVVRGADSAISISPTAVIGINTSDDPSLFPIGNGAFRIYKTDLSLKYPDLLTYGSRTSGQLRGISRINGTSTGMTIAAGEYIVLQRFLNVVAKGKAGSDASNMFASRTLSYHIPVEAFSTWGDISLSQTNLLEIDATAPTSLVGRPGYAVIPDDQQQIAVLQEMGIHTDNQPAVSINPNVNADPPDRVFININWWDLPILDFQQALVKQLGTLSYSLQFKPKVRAQSGSQLGNNLVGLSLRVSDNNINTNSFYGVSFFKSLNKSNDTSYPLWLGQAEIPPTTYALKNLTKGLTYLVFWKSEGGVITLLGHYPITGLQGTDPNTAIILDWPTLVVQIKETAGSQQIKFIVYTKAQNPLQTIRWPTEAEWTSSAITLYNNLTNTSTFSGSDLSFRTSGLTSIPTPNPDDGTSACPCEICINCVQTGGTCGRPEIGIHLYTVGGGDASIWVDDFAIDMPGASTYSGDIGFLPGTVDPL